MTIAEVALRSVAKLGRNVAKRDWREFGYFDGSRMRSCMIPMYLTWAQQISYSDHVTVCIWLSPKITAVSKQL